MAASHIGVITRMSGGMAMRQSIDDIMRLYADKGGESYGEDVTQEQHALQCAALAEAAGAAPELIAAALLHDIGHLLGEADPGHGCYTHDAVGATFLSELFGPQVTDPIRLHVAAKRYLCAVDPDYRAQLSEESRHSLAMQGGPMTAEEQRAFESEPHFAAAVELRRWDDAGKVEGLKPRAFESFLPLLDSVRKPAGCCRD